MEDKYEFDAPGYVDFDAVREGTEEEGNVDDWFSRHLEDDMDILDFGPTENEPRAFSSDFTGTSKQHVQEEPTNGDQQEAAAVATSSRDVKPAVVKTEAEDGEAAVAKPPVKLGGKRSAAIASLQTPVMKQQRVQRESSKKAAASIHKILHNKPPEHQSVTAKTPEHLRRYLAKKQSQVKKTREQLDEEEMERMQQESKKKLRQNRKSFHRLADSSKKANPVKKYSKPTTESVGFHFRTERRCRMRAAATTAAAAASGPPPHSSGSHPNNFPMTLRSAGKNTIHSEVPHTKCTAAKPFNFHLKPRLTLREAARKREEEANENKKGYVSTAEYIFKFQTETPERFRTLSRKSQHPASAAVDESVQSSKAGVTMPYTPKLQTKTRARPTIVRSAAELEEEELSKIRSNPIRPQPLNPKVFSQQGLLGVPKKPHLPPTEPHTPKLATKERGEARNEAMGGASEENTDVSFKAQPLPKGIFEKVLGLPKKQHLPPTCPESPAFALKRRKLHHSSSEDEEEEEEKQRHIIVAHPVPNFSHKFEPQLTHKKTEPEPFAFEERYKNKPTRETLVQQILQKEKRQPFKANPLPDFEGPILPPVRQQPMTEPRTPTLHTKTRGKEHESKWRQKLDEMSQKAKENAEFRAKEATVLYKPPFIAAKPNCPMTEVSNFVLHTEMRSKQRAKFDTELEQQEQRREQENRERQAITEAEEAKKMAAMRRSLVHKALPISHYTSTVIKPSSKPLTAPHSPHFHIRLRGLH